jgi:hypothetical protein
VELEAGSVTAGDLFFRGLDLAFVDEEFRFVEFAFEVDEDPSALEDAAVDRDCFAGFGTAVVFLDFEAGAASRQAHELHRVAGEDVAQLEGDGLAVQLAPLSWPDPPLNVLVGAERSFACAPASSRAARAKRKMSAESPSSANARLGSFMGIVVMPLHRHFPPRL